MTRHLLPLACATAVLLAGGPLVAAPGDQPVEPLSRAAQPDPDPTRTSTTALPARGLFVGDKLSESARAQLAELIIDAAGRDVEVALVVPTGPWQIDGSGAGERDLTPARLQAVRRFLADRGIDPRRIFVESRTDATIKEPQLTVQIIGRLAND